MIHSIEIDGYRGFNRFEMNNLGLVNLLVGGNNNGKTSVLEAIYLLTSRGDPSSVLQLLWRRGEHLPNEQRPQQFQPEFDICHLFTGHDLQAGTKIVLSSKNQTPKRVLEFQICEPTENDRKNIARFQSGAHSQFPYVIHITGSEVPPYSMIPISRKGGVPLEFLQAPRVLHGKLNDDSDRAKYISTESLTSRELVSMWDKISLTPNQALVLKAIQFLDPSIEQIAAQSINDYGNQTRGGFKIKLKGREIPVPIGSMGDGMWRMLAMAIAVTQSKGGVLLVDEIDTGLHYSVMSEMWKLLYNAAKEFGVQIFATTHSSDCVQSFAKICSDGQDSNTGVTLHRIESGKNKSIPYTEGEIKMACERKIEVR